MKFNLAEKQQRKKEEDPNAIDTKCCVICDKVLFGAYGRWNSVEGEVWTCSKSHDVEYMERRNVD